MANRRSYDHEDERFSRFPRIKFSLEETLNFVGVKSVRNARLVAVNARTFFWYRRDTQDMRGREGRARIDLHTAQQWFEKFTGDDVEFRRSETRPLKITISQIRGGIFIRS